MPLAAPYRNGSLRTKKVPSNGVLGPGDFPLGSIESRAAARLRLKKPDIPPDYLEISVEQPPEGADHMTPWFGPWERVTGVREIEHDPAPRRAPQRIETRNTEFNITIEDVKILARRMMGIGINGDFKRDVYAPPSVWRVLPVGEVNLSDVDVPCCSGCGTRFVETGRYGILVQLTIDCAARHDPAPPPKFPQTQAYEKESARLATYGIKMSVEQLKRLHDEMRESAREMMFSDAAEDIKDYLASQLGIHSYDMYEFISQRREATDVLRQQIAPLLKNWDFVKQHPDQREVPEEL